MMGYTDFHRSIDGLAEIVQGQLRLDPFSKALLPKKPQAVVICARLDGKVLNEHGETIQQYEHLFK